MTQEEKVRELTDIILKALVDYPHELTSTDVMSALMTATKSAAAATIRLSPPGTGDYNRAAIVSSLQAIISDVQADGGSSTIH